jgi:hypothetical protein
MHLYNLCNFFLLFLSCTISAALPAGGRCVVPTNSDNSSIRNINGASVPLLSNQVIVTIAQAHIDQTSSYPFGGFVVTIQNDYCIRVEVRFTLPNGDRHNVLVGARSNSGRVTIPERVAQGGVLHVEATDTL